ncbi:hypothetical protein BD769DRAFT_1664889 [Suillus cothurnatus]|nr:hypothetical protein BD769DRAFT_1664889 [Suillus cothurnatus]
MSDQVSPSQTISNRMRIIGLVEVDITGSQPAMVGFNSLINVSIIYAHPSHPPTTENGLSQPWIASFHSDKSGSIAHMCERAASRTLISIPVILGKRKRPMEESLATVGYWFSFPAVSLNVVRQPVETAHSLSGSPSRHKLPNPPPTRYRCHSRLYASATTVSSNLLVSESAAEHRRTNARTHLRSQLFGSRPNSDEPRDSSDISNLTVTARLRRLIIASQADSSSNTSSRILSSGRTSDLPSRQFALNGS